MADRDMPRDQMPDKQLLASFAAGDRDALGELARRYERSLLGLACGLLGGRRDLALDAVQEMWLRVIRFARNFNGQSRVKTWLYRITINECRALRAKIARDAKRQAASVIHVESPGKVSEESGSDDAQRVREAVGRLDDHRRTLVLLCYHAGMTHVQAADILGIPLGTLKSRLHATLTHLRQSLPEEVQA